MLTYTIVFLIALCASFILTPIIRNAARRIDFVDTPSEERQIHTVPIPRVGGIAMVIAFFLALVPLYFLDGTITQTLHGSREQLLRFVVPCLAVFVLGLADDIYRLRPRTKFIGQVIIAIGFHFFAQGITTLPNPFTGTSFQLGMWGLPITVLWLVGVSNAFNLIDGVDGLSAGSALFSTLTMLYVAVANQNLILAVLACALAGSILGFLKYNFNPATVFMGDCGSLFIGFTLAALSILGSQKSVTIVTITIPLLAFGLPVMETALSIGRRFLSGKPLFGADRRHIHHQLLARGFSQRKTTILLYAASAFFALMSLLAYNSPNRLLGLILLTLGVALWIAIQHLGYHEFGEIGRILQRSLSQRTLIANNIHVQNLVQALRGSQTHEEFFNHLGECFAATDFTQVRLHLPLRMAWQIQEHRYFRFSRHDDFVTAIWTEEGQPEHLPHTAKLSLPLGFDDAQFGRMDLHRLPDSTFLFDVNLLFGRLREVTEETLTRLNREPAAERHSGGDSVGEMHLKERQV